MYFVLFVSIACISVVIFFLKRVRNKCSLDKEHVLITGGSSGIGLAFAVEVVRKGASVTIIARDKEKLERAKEKIQTYAKSPDQNVFAISFDVSQYSTALPELLKEAENKSGLITFLVNCAGTSVSYRFEETPIEEFKRMVDLNYLGSVYVTRAVLPSMKKHKKGKIVFFSSLAGLAGLYGYTAYSASKFALVGMAQALQMEVKSYNINVTVAFPQDTDTPGFAEEIKSKPLETQLISESAGLFTAEQVAAKTLDDALNNRFMSSGGMEGWLLCTLCCGMSPAPILDVIVQILTMGLSRLIGYVCLLNFDKIIKKCFIEKQKITRS